MISILSLSVKITFLSLCVAIPIKEKFFKNSHPKAPAPIIKIFNSDNFSCILFLKIAICSSYLEFFKALSISLGKFSIISEASNQNH